MEIRNKQTGRIRVVTPAEYEAICQKGDHFATLYEVVNQTAPPTPKEIKKMSGKQNPESDNDGLQTTFDGLPQQDAG